MDRAVERLEASDEVLEYHYPFDITYRDGQISPQPAGFYIMLNVSPCFAHSVICAAIHDNPLIHYYIAFS